MSTTARYLEQRRDRARKQIQSQSVGALLITDLSNLFYLTGFRGSDGACLLTEKRSILLVDGRYGAQAREQAPECEVVVYPAKLQGLAEAIRSEAPSHVGFESRSVSVEFFNLIQKELPAIEWKPADSWLSSFRAVKDDHELQILARAFQLADEAFNEILPMVRVGAVERNIANELEHRMKSKGAEKPSFDALIASGIRTALPHAKPSEKKIESSDFVFVDFGCSYQGYQTDQTVTLCVGKPQSPLREVYEIVKEAHDRAIDALRPGITATSIDAVARDFIVERGYGEQFSHSLGHGVGIEVHEYPSISSRSKATLEEGMIVTIEPGIYIPGVGGVRIEDSLIVTKTGSKRLTGLDKAFRSL